MKKPSVQILWLVSAIVALFSFAAFAAESKSIERIGGNFTVTKISKNTSNQGFVVEFKASEGSPKITLLRLETDHVNAGLSEGETIRLSADVRSHSGNSADIEQVVVYLPGRSGPTPVWMLSKKAKLVSPPAKLIEMHSPSTDYTVF
jgi:hypothetical protein